MSGDWKLALEQKKDLSIRSGSVSELGEAVGQGADLRLYLTAINYEETIYFQQTYAGEAGAFAGLMSHHHGYVHHGQDVEQPNVSIFKYDTSGTFSQVKWMWGGVILDESQPYPYGVYRWFTCDRWRLVYEHDDSGQKVSGDLDELKDHIRQGRSIKVGIENLFGLVQDQKNGPQHISFLTTMQPLIQGEHVLSNCDLVVIGAPKWPFTWKDGLHLAIMRPSTSGEVLCFASEPGKLPFTRIVRRRAMRWMVAERV